MSKKTASVSTGRREVIKGLASIPLATTVIGCEAKNQSPRAAFSHGVASGDPEHDRIILWTRATPLTTEIGDIEIDWELALDESLNSVVASGTATAGALHDYTVKVDAAGLEPATAYFYRFRSGSNISITGRTKTLPIGRTESVKLATLCCANMPLGYFNAYLAVAKRTDIDAVLHLGDYIYEYRRDRYGEASIKDVDRVIEPLHEITSLSDYRARYASYRLDQDLQAAHARHPFIAVWDDHDSANNSWSGGAKNHNEGEGEWTIRRAVAQQAWLEWLPIRETDYTASGRIYRTFDFGDLASLIVLDARLIGRDMPLDYSTDLNLDLSENSEGNEQLAEAFRENKLGANDRSMLGFEQEAWLKERMAASKQRGQTWQLLGQQVVMGEVKVPPFDPDWLDPDMTPWPRQNGKNMMAELIRLDLPTNLDAWGGFPAARDRLLRDVSEHCSNALVLSGDSHNAWACALPGNSGNVAAEFAVQSVTSHGLEVHLPFNQEKIAASYVAASPELLWTDTHHRGYMTLTLTQDNAHAEWWILDTVRERTFTITRAKGLTLSATNTPGIGPVVNV